MKCVPLFFTLALVLAAIPEAEAGPLDPITLTVVGQGAIQVRITSGITQPCDSGDNEPVFEGWLSPGPHRLLAPRGPLCIQHTYGEWREGEWSTPFLTSTVIRAWRRGPIVPLEMHVSTDTPFR